jgi:hypothetical protein
MPKSKYMVSIIIAVFVIGGLLVYYKSTAATEVRDHKHGPFTIRMEKFSTKNFNMNYGWVTQYNISYSVLHHGKIVEFPGELQSNTGFSHLWRAYILKDAPQPTIVAGSQSLYMIIAKGDSYEVKPLEIQSSDFIKFQWLDEHNGQPGEAFELFMGDERTDMDHPDTLQGGKYLMISQKNVLYVPTMTLFRFNAENRSVDNYNKDGDALAFSPDEKIIVFPGYFQSWSSNEIPKCGDALVSYDFKNDGMAVLPYSKNETRMFKQSDIHIYWFNTYFKWDTSGTETVLNFQKPEKLNHILGYFRDDYYYLFPAYDTMVVILKQFVLDYMKWKPEAVLSEEYHEYTGRVFKLGLEKSMFYLVGKENDVHIGSDIYGEEGSEVKKWIHKIGNAFNDELKTGKYQEHFTTVQEYEPY